MRRAHRRSPRRHRRPSRGAATPPRSSSSCARCATQLDAPGVLEVCVNRPGEMLVETGDGWHALAAPELTLERCLSLATAVATFSDQQINQERPLLAATLPTGERVQFAIPPAVDPRHRLDHDPQARRAAAAARRLRAGRPVRAHRHREPNRGRRAAALRAGAGRAEGRRPATPTSCAWRCAGTRPSSSAARPARARRPS